MKTNRRVYIVCSLQQVELFMVFGTLERAQKWIDEFDKHKNTKLIFDKSKKEDLYITKRIIF